MKTFINAKIILPNSIIENGFLIEKGGKIAEFGDMKNFTECGESVINCEGLYLSPGFIDIHTHGGGGFDFMDGTTEAMVGASRAHLKHGTTSLLPTTLTSSDEDLFLTIENFKKAQKVTENMPNLLGLHLEGPYFNLEQKGAQDERYIINPKSEHYNKIMKKADGAILRWSLAPELEGAMEMANALSKQNVMVSIAHSNATYKQVEEAVKNGFSHITHLYSAMSTISRKDGYRVLGIIESAYIFDELTVEIIADGAHLPKELLKLIVKCKDNDKICLVTDSMRGADMPDGASILGGIKDGQAVILEDGIAKMPDRSCFAGSVATADRLIRVMTKEAGLSLEGAVAMLSLNPARFINYDKKKGSIDLGKDADLILFDDGINIKNVFVCGRQCL